MYRSILRFALVLVAGSTLFLITACGSGEPASPAGADAGFVAGDGSIVVLPVAGRQPAPALIGPVLKLHRWER